MEKRRRAGEAHDVLQRVWRMGKIRGDREERKNMYPVRWVMMMWDDFVSDAHNAGSSSPSPVNPMLLPPLASSPFPRFPLHGVCGSY